MKPLLVSVIVTTRNNEATLEACLASIAAQTYATRELIVVDNHSTDGTVQIAERFTQQVFTKGPERSTQRNLAVSQAKGVYVVIIDSDMELEPTVLQDCVDAMRANARLGAVIIPEESFGQGFWAQCKRLERSFYVGVPWMEAARFFDRKVYLQVGGYDEQLVSGEDWDLSQRVGRVAGIGHIDTYIRHNEGRLSLLKTLRKKYYYAQKFAAYLRANPHTQEAQLQTGLAARYKLFLSKPVKLFRNPFYATGMLFMKTCEFAVGGLGYLRTR